ncbi:hypothetical protein QFZ49_003438 [Streptomyces turgidiscabies]|uniref:Uncharacterized protein n=1 Tax=Streptomyces turgidiscabies TaxID=85558 RepID=A0ABU0RP29_9ACTN|nr:hypothetical protein [Streptomyces turgidiscabies]
MRRGEASRTFARPVWTPSPIGLSICTRYPTRLRRGTRRSYQIMAAEAAIPTAAVATATMFSALSHSMWVPPASPRAGRRPDDSRTGSAVTLRAWAPQVPYREGKFA